MTESTKQFPVKFMDFDCIVETGRYTNNRLAIELVDDEGPVAVATVNMPEESLAPDEVIIKNYSENEGMVKSLKEAGVITALVRHAGFQGLPVYKVNPDLLT